jgi:hypothetical protein
MLEINMNAIRQIVDVEAGQIIIKLPKEYNKKQVEVIVKGIEVKKSKPDILKLIPKNHCGEILGDLSRESLYEDANIVASMPANGITHILTNNEKDFQRFTEIKVIALNSGYQ